MKLDAHGWTLDLRPDCGGAVGALRHRGDDVLRHAPPGSTDVLAAGCFPLIPYANRIAHGMFELNGERHRLPLNFGDHPHSLHGLGWQARWRAAEAGADHATLVHTHGGGAGWPWRYRGEQRFELAPGRARVALTLTCEDEAAMPAGTGLHPYFPLDAATRLTFAAARVWLADATMLPTSPAPADHFGDWAAGQAVAGDTLIDNAFDGWDGALAIEQRWGRITLTAEGANILHLYRPPGAAFFCAEPVSHLPDAVNRGGMAILEPGETLTLAMTLAVE